MSSATNADRNLLFGMFALQNDNLTQDQLIEAFQAWILRKDLTLDAIIRDKGWMTIEEIESLNSVLDRRAAKVGGQRQLLAAMPNDRGILHDLARVTGNDDDIVRSAATTVSFFSESNRQDAQASPKSEVLFQLSGKKDESKPPSSVPAAAFENPQVVLSATAVPPNAHETPTGQIRVCFETEFTFTEPEDFLGNGAYGEVFRCEDREFQRKTALKRLQKKHLFRGLTPDRFLLEAEINGKLDHPGVVPMYGLGKTAAGVPFYVMKAIESPTLGQRIEEYHTAEDTPGRHPGESNQQFRKLLDHLRSVCMTMQYAHDRGVLHCDLKPSNIMTGSYGETYVVDWGQALIVNPVEDWDKTRDHVPVNHPLGEIHPDRRKALHVCQGGMRFDIGGTYAYMSPEHRHTHENQESYDLKAMTPACDVFALGVILYQILTGKLPCTAVENEDNARHAERARTADYVPPSNIKPGVPKALNAICMKALAPEVKDRYRSAAALEDDLEKWLADEPVSAYQENRAERSRRWIRKNRGKAATIAASLVFATLSSIAGLIVQSIYTNRIAAERDRAQFNERRAIASEKAEHEQRTLAEKNADEAIKARNLMKITVDAMFNLYESASKNDRIADDPAFQKLRQDLLNQSKGIVYPNGTTVFPTSSITPHINETIIPRKPIVEPPPTMDDRKSKENSLNKHDEPKTGGFAPESEPRLEFIPPGYIKEDSKEPDLTSPPDRFPPAVIPLPELPPPVEDSSKVPGMSLPDAVGRETRPDVAEIKRRILAEAREKMATEALREYSSNLAMNEQLKNRPELKDVRKELLRAPIEFFEKRRDERLAAGDTRVESLESLALDLRQLAFLSDEIGDKQSAKLSYSQAIEIYERLNQAKPLMSDYRKAMGSVYFSLGLLEDSDSKPDAARAAYVRAIRTYESLIESNPKVSEFRIDLARALNNLGALERNAGQTDHALAAYERAIRTYEALVEANPAETEFRNDLANSLTNLGILEITTGKIDHARASYERAIRTYEALVEANPKVSDFRNDLGSVLINLGVLESADGKPLASRAAYERAIRIFESLVETNPQVAQFRNRLATVLTNLGGLESNSGNPDAARLDYERAIRIYEALAQTNPMTRDSLAGLGFTLINIGNLEVKSGRHVAARPVFERAVRTFESLVKEYPEDTGFRDGLAKAHITLGVTSSISGNFLAARVAYEQAIEIYETLLQANPKVLTFRNGLEIALHNYFWFLAGQPGRQPDDYAKANKLAESAVKLIPDNGGIILNLGVAQYRTEQYAKAAATIARSAELNKKVSKGIEPPANLAFLAMAQWKLGQRAEAEATYARLAETMKRPEFAQKVQARQFFREATNLIHPMTLPEDPFQK